MEIELLKGHALFEFYTESGLIDLPLASASQRKLQSPSSPSRSRSRNRTRASSSTAAVKPSFLPAR
ncbi:MAG: hypothetical protein RL333_391 [Pseudomonadota bacterium]